MCKYYHHVSLPNYVSVSFVYSLLAKHFSPPLTWRSLRVSSHVENLAVINLPKTIKRWESLKDFALFKSDFSLQDKYDTMHYYIPV